MQLTFHFRQFFFLSLAMLVAAITTQAQEDQRAFRKPRVFEPVQCHHYRQLSPEREDIKPTPQPRWMMNYDMSTSIARSDSFNISTYELDLDVTAYAYQQLVAHAVIALEVLEDDAQDLWFDLVELTVDSVAINGTPALFEQTESQLHLALPEAGWQTNTGYEVEVWYQGSPYQDPYWGGFYFVSDYIYNLGIGLTTIPPNFGKVWYPCFDNFVERAAYTYHDLGPHSGSRPPCLSV